MFISLFKMELDYDIKLAKIINVNILYLYAVYATRLIAIRPKYMDKQG